MICTAVNICFIHVQWVTSHKSYACLFQGGVVHWQPMYIHSAWLWNLLALFPTFPTDQKKELEAFSCSFCSSFNCFPSKKQTGPSSKEHTHKMRLFDQESPPSSVYLGRHWRHSRDKMDQAFPFRFCTLQVIKNGRWGGLGTTLGFGPISLCTMLFQTCL